MKNRHDGIQNDYAPYADSFHAAITDYARELKKLLVSFRSQEEEKNVPVVQW